jgi:hypothetical protein
VVLDKAGLATSRARRNKPNSASQACRMQPASAPSEERTMAKTPTVALCRAVIFGVLSPCDRLQCGCEDTGRGYGSL